MGLKMGPLVTTEWLAAELGEPDLVVFDATKYLPNEPKDGRAEFLRGHIPGAAFFDIDEVADTETDLPHMVPTPGRFAKLVGALGVGNASRVVFYDQKGLASAARGWWLMGLFGHDNVAVLDGGLPKWVKEGRPVHDGEAEVPVPGQFRPDYRARQLRGVGDYAAQCADRRRTGAGCAGGGTVQRGGAGASGGNAQRTYPGFGQPALYRTVASGWDVPAGGRGAWSVRGSGVGWVSACGDELRVGRYGLHSDTRAAGRGFSRGRGV